MNHRPSVTLSVPQYELPDAEAARFEEGLPLVRRVEEVPERDLLEEADGIGEEHVDDGEGGGDGNGRAEDERGHDEVLAGAAEGTFAQRAGEVGAFGGIR